MFFCCSAMSCQCLKAVRRVFYAIHVQPALLDRPGPTGAWLDLARGAPVTVQYHAGPLVRRLVDAAQAGTVTRAIPCWRHDGTIMSGWT